MRWKTGVLLQLLTSIKLHSYSYYDYYYEDTVDSDNSKLLTVLLDSSFTVSCQTDQQQQTSLSSNEINLYHNDTFLADTDDNLRYNATSDSWLIVRARVEHAGHWGCDGANTMVAVLPHPQQAVIIVNDRVIQGSGNVMRLEEDQWISPVCAIIASNTLQYHGDSLPSWTIDGGMANGTQDTSHQLDADGREHIHLRLDTFRVTRDHAGKTLQCSIFGQSVDVLLDVEYPPQFTISRDPHFGSPVTVGSSMTLSCQVDSAPTTTAFWQHNGAVVSNTSVLFIPTLSADHGGWYQCNANHKLGNFSSVGYFLSVKQSEDVDLTPAPPSHCDQSSTVTGRPHVFTPIHNISTTRGQNVTIYSQYCSSVPPLAIVWSGPQVVLSLHVATQSSPDRFNTKVVSRDSNCTTVSLMIGKVETEDSGGYIFMVSTSEGVEQGKIWLDVAQGGEMVSAVCDNTIVSLILVTASLLLSCHSF